MSLAITISQPHARFLASHLFPQNGCEAGAVLLLGTADCASHPWGDGTLRRFLSHVVTIIPPEDIVEASSHHFTWRKATFLRLIKRAMEEKLAICFLHSHRGGLPAFFSEADDQNDRDVAELVANRTRRQVDYVSVVIDEQGGCVARTLEHGAAAQAVDRCTVLGSPWQWSCAEVDGSLEPFDRLTLAFGPDFLRASQTMRIGIVGAGATGSATAVLLARNGARHLAIFDPDIVDRTNLSRLHGATLDDATRGVPKVDCLKAHIEGFGLGTEVHCYRTWIGDPAVRDAVRSCELLFGCSDDHSGRLFLNRFSFFYNTPVIDMGIAIDPLRLRDGTIARADARVTVVTPGTACLLCRRNVDPNRASAEDLYRSNPQEYARLKAEGYIDGHDIPNPAVIALTTTASAMAIDELTARLTGYREYRDNRVTRFKIMRETFPGVDDERLCPLCVDPSYWGRGDIQPFLDRIG